MVTMRKAGLWTDSRYWTQAERQMDCNWELHKEGKRVTCPPNFETWTRFKKAQVRGRMQSHDGPLRRLWESETVPNL